MPNDNKKFRNICKDYKRDEFYTPMEFIEEELDHYAAQFENKIVYCPCDDPRWSNFVGYFINNFNKLHLQAVYCSYYDESAQERAGVHVYWCVKRVPGNRSKDSDDKYGVFDENKGWTFDSVEAAWVRNHMVNNGWKLDDSLIVGCAKKGFFEYANTNDELFPCATQKGSFNSREAMQLAELSDVIVTNPPFSKFGEFIDFCLRSNSKFICVGSNIAVNMKPIYKAWKEGLLHSGYTANKPIQFVRPDGTTKGVAVTWYTNMEVFNSVKEFKSGKLLKDVDPMYFDDRPDVMYLDKVANYPDDYYGLCAVPVNAFYRFSPAYFDIVACPCSPYPNDGGFCDRLNKEDKYGMTFDNGRTASMRVVVRRRKLEGVKLTVENMVEQRVLNNIAPAQTNGRGYVYIISDESGRVKIGITKNPAKQRLDELQTGNAESLSLVSVSNPVFNYAEVEAEVHKQLSAYHIKGEWFDGSCALSAVKMITEMTAPSKQDVKRFRNI